MDELAEATAAGMCAQCMELVIDAIKAINSDDKQAALRLLDQVKDCLKKM